MIISSMADYEIKLGNCLQSLRELPPQSVNCCVTSPPYFGLRDYGVDGQIGLEPTPDEFVQALVEVFREVRRVLRDDGTLWLNLGDSYARSPAKGGSGPSGKNREWLKQKDLIGIPWRVAFALQADGWYLRQDIIWHKPNPMPESVRDRCTKAHEYIFMLTKSPRYHYDHEAVMEPAVTAENRSGRGKYHLDDTMKARGLALAPARPFRNRRSVWTVATRPYKGAHFATFPPALIEPCILAGCPEGGTVLDPFGGSGTTAGVALKHGRSAILCELNPEYADLIPQRVEAILAGHRGPGRERPTPSNDNEEQMDMGKILEVKP